MIRANRRLGTAAGFTMIEVMVALTIFGIVTLGIVPLLAASLQGAGLSRSATVGKNLAVEAMERARGLPYFVDYPTQKSYSNGIPPFRKVDVVDLLFPDIANSAYTGSTATYNGGNGVYTTTCTASDSTNPACPRRLPDGYTLEYRARFVRAIEAAGEETYQVEIPPAAYRWNPDPYTSVDTPPAQLMELTVSAGWTFGGRVRKVELTSIIGDREFGEVAIRGTGKVDYVVQVTAPFEGPDDDDPDTELVARGGLADSAIETKTSSTADQTARAAMLELVNPAVPDSVIASAEGAVSAVHAPPDSAPVGDSGGISILTHPGLGIDIAGIDETNTDGLDAQVDQDLPAAHGNFSFDVTESPARIFWANSQVGEDTVDVLQLNDGAPMLRFRDRGLGTIFGDSMAETDTVDSATRRVETAASAEFGRLRLLPTFLPSTLAGDTSDNSVVVVDDFSASVDCKSTGSVSGANPASAGADWSATLWYLADINPGNNLPLVEYRRIDLGSAFGADPLAAIGPANNPLVYDALIPGDDVYLFDDQSAGRTGYLRTWSSADSSSPSVKASVDAAGRVTEASVDGAIRIDTARTDPENPDSTMSLQVGKLGCEASDQR